MQQWLIKDSPKGVATVYQTEISYYWGIIILFIHLHAALRGGLATLAIL